MLAPNPKPKEPKSEPNFKFEADTDGIALITWDMPDRSMNVITVSVMEELKALIDKVCSDAAIKGAVITSGKDTFGGGADLTLLERLIGMFHKMAKDQGELAASTLLFEESRKLSQLYRYLETCGKPRSEERRVGKECRSRWSPEQ